MAFCQQCGTQNPDGSRFCTGCGADLTAQAAPQQAAPVNPNMGGQQVYSQQPTYGQTPQAFAQSGIGNYGTPAGLSKKDLKPHLDEFYKNKKLLPKDFFSQSNMDKITGVYVPFWLFSSFCAIPPYHSFTEIK